MLMMILSDHIIFIIIIFSKMYAKKLNSICFEYKLPSPIYDSSYKDDFYSSSVRVVIT